MNLKKFTQKDRFGNMLSYEFEANVPEMTDIPPAFQPGPRGTDTHPAWLTPGENVINAEASRIPGVQPALDKLNEIGRDIQDKQGGPIPTYAQEGSKITPKVLDAIMQVESGGDPSKVSPVGASGPYQIMKDTALNPGFGVQPISLEDRFDPDISRNFAENYLKGIEKANPNFSLDEILQSYHSGIGNVKKGNIGPEGQAYPFKVYDASQKPDSIPFISDADASTLDNQNKIPPKPNIRDEMKKKYGDDIILDSLGNVQQVNPNRIDPKLLEKYAKELVDNPRYTKEMYDRDVANYNQAVKQDNAFKSEQSIKDDNLKIEEDSKINNELANIDKQIEENKNDPNVIAVLEKKKKDLLANKSETKSLSSAQKILDNMKDKVDVKDEQDLSDKNQKDLEDKGKEVDPNIQDTVKSWFTNTFKDMFSGEELARMSIIYLGSRALGYNHNASLKHSAKQYLKRVDAQATARQKFVTNKDNLNKFTKDSLMKYRYSGDLNDLVRVSGTGIISGGTGSRLWVRGYGPMEKVKVGKDKYMLMDKAGRKFSFDDPAIRGNFFTYDDDQMDLEKITAKYSKSIADVQKVYNNQKKGDDVIRSNISLLANEAADLIYQDMITFGVRPNDRSQMNKAMERAIDLYYKELREHVDTKGEVKKPNSLQTYYNQIKMPLRTNNKISFNDLNDSGTGEYKDKKLSNEKFLVIDKLVMGGSKDGKDYVKEWELLKEIWNEADASKKESFNAGAPEGFSGFGWWAFNFMDNKQPALELYKPRKK